MANQTIDGVLVPRELLELAMLELVDTFSWAGELRALLDASIPFPGYPPVPEDRKLPASQPQGEPVGWISMSLATGQCEQVSGPEEVNNLEYWSPAFPVYAEQPAPVAVVLPERLPGDDGVCTESHYASGWNTCLDELKRLNPSL